MLFRFNLTLKAPITTAADDILNFFFFLIFQRKQVLIFHANSHAISKLVFFEKFKKIKINVICYKFCLAALRVKNSLLPKLHIIVLDKRAVPINIFLFLHENLCCEYSLEMPHFCREIRIIIPFGLKRGSFSQVKHHIFLALGKGIF